MPDPETLTLRVTVIGGKRDADDFEVIWRDLSIGRIIERSGVPSQTKQSIAVGALRVCWTSPFTQF
jgi:hypothetical protein